MIKALWLTSWYPNRLDAMNGDFIQRHARAACLFCEVHVIHLEADKKNVLRKTTETTITKQNNLVEEIVLYKLSHVPIFNKIFSQGRYVSIFKKHINAYIKEYGKPDIVHVHVPIKAGILALWLKHKYGIPYVVTEHWAIYNDKAVDAYSKRNFIFKYNTKKILQQAAIFIPVSDDLGRSVQKLVINVPFTVVPNVVDTAVFNYERPAPVENDVFTFLHVSTLKYQKNPEGILRAFKEFLKINPASKLIMVGEVPGVLKQYLATLEVPPGNIEFTGLIAYEEVAAVMKKSDAFILFSRYENLPCVIIEALCCGLPVISTNTGGIKEVVNNANGFIINSEDEGALLKSMQQAYMQNGNFARKSISENASASFSYKIVGKKLMQLYVGVTSNQISGPGK